MEPRGNRSPPAEAFCLFVILSFCIFVFLSRWTPEATVLRLLRLCQEAELAENGLTPNNAMLYAFTSKMKKMKQKKFQNFPKIQRRRRRVSASIFTQTGTSWDALSYNNFCVSLYELHELCGLFAVALH